MIPVLSGSTGEPVGMCLVGQVFEVFRLEHVGSLFV